MARRRKTHDLSRLFELSRAPIYALDADRRIIFANTACLNWLGVAPEELIGQESRYHSEPGLSPAEAAAAAISPPPEAYEGARCTTAVLAPTGAAANAVAWRFEFVPLLDGESHLSGVMATGIEVVAAPDEHAAGESGAELHKLLQHYRRKLALRYRPDRLVGASAVMRRARAQVELAAASDIHVTIVGPPGSGRLHAARAIHYGRGDQARSVATLNCEGLSSESLLDELSRAARAGAAAGSRVTIILQGADRLALEAQAELLARLSAVESHVRLIAIADEAPLDLSAHGAFRSELALALGAIVISLPPLKARKEDLPLVCQAIVEEINSRSDKQLSGLTPEALDRLSAYPFPGNLDELAEMLESAHAQARGVAITARDLSELLRIAAEAQARPRRAEETIQLDKFIADVERELVTRALKHAKGNKAKAARLLGMTRPRLYRRLVQLGLIEADAGELPEFIEQPEEP